MKSFIVLCVALLTTSCASNIDDHFRTSEEIVNKRSPFIEKEFLIHVQKFEEISGVEVNMLIEWGDLEPSIMGVCYSWAGGYREIKIDKVKWTSLSYLGQEELILHELGHCVLDLDHDEGVVDMGSWTSIPKSIMYPYVFGNKEYYKQFNDYYHSQLVERR